MHGSSVPPPFRVYENRQFFLGPTGRGAVLLAHNGELIRIEPQDRAVFLILAEMATMSALARSEKHA
jgi:hypothetical protein